MGKNRGDKGTLEKINSISRENSFLRFLAIASLILSLLYFVSPCITNAIMNRVSKHSITGNISDWIGFYSNYFSTVLTVLIGYIAFYINFLLYKLRSIENSLNNNLELVFSIKTNIIDNNSNLSSIVSYNEFIHLYDIVSSENFIILPRKFKRELTKMMAITEQILKEFNDFERLFMNYLNKELFDVKPEAIVKLIDTGKFKCYDRSLKKMVEVSLSSIISIFKVSYASEKKAMLDGKINVLNYLNNYVKVKNDFIEEFALYF